MDSDVNDSIRLTEKKLNKIARKSMYRKPDMIGDEDNPSDEESKDGVTSNDIISAMKKAEISRFKEKLQKKQNDLENFERMK